MRINAPSMALPYPQAQPAAAPPLTFGQGETFDKYIMGGKHGEVQDVPKPWQPMFMDKLSILLGEIQYSGAFTLTPANKDESWQKGFGIGRDSLGKMILDGMVFCNRCTSQVLKKGEVLFKPQNPQQNPVESLKVSVKRRLRLYTVSYELRLKNGTGYHHSETNLYKKLSQTTRDYLDYLKPRVLDAAEQEKQDKALSKEQAARNKAITKGFDPDALENLDFHKH